MLSENIEMGQKIPLMSDEQALYEWVQSTFGIQMNKLPPYRPHNMPRNVYEILKKFAARPRDFTKLHAGIDLDLKGRTDPRGRLRYLLVNKPNYFSAVACTMPSGENRECG